MGNREWGVGLLIAIIVYWQQSMLANFDPYSLLSIMSPFLMVKKAGACTPAFRLITVRAC